ncbi:MAG TPA: hypothetical protein PK920_14365 [Phycisphaerae bacterium]|nr:hypothetical protein [Phycisphaerae bacterium]HRT43173.1 hypothetical protein [Phycisphaerae bacterium]
MTARSLRSDMPLVTEFVDALREVFGRPAVDASIRAGLDGQPTFWASENGIEIGARLPDTGLPVSQMVIGPLCQSTPPPRRDPQ